MRAQVRFAPEFMLRNQGGDFDTADRLFHSIARAQIGLLLVELVKRRR
jgi:hypothetical protein